MRVGMSIWLFVSEAIFWFTKTPSSAFSRWSVDPKQTRPKLAMATDGTEVKKVIVPKTAADVQRFKLQKLLKNPDKPAFIPEKPEEKLPRVFKPPEFVRNIWGSSAGAGSGDFHVYRGVRRREYARQKFLNEKADKQGLDEEFQKRLVEKKAAAEDRTAKKRAKRLKKKMNKKSKKMKPIENAADKQDNDSEESDKESDEENQDLDQNGRPDEEECTKSPSAVESEQDGFVQNTCSVGKHNTSNSLNNDNSNSLEKLDNDNSNSSDSDN